MKLKIFCDTFSLTREWNLYLIDFLAFHMLALQWLAPCKNSVKWLTEAEMALADYPTMSLIFGSEIQISWVGRPTKMAHALWGRRLCKLPLEPAPPLHRSSHGAPSRTEEHFWSEKDIFLNRETSHLLTFLLRREVGHFFDNVLTVLVRLNQNLICTRWHTYLSNGKRGNFMEFFPKLTSSLQQDLHQVSKRFQQKMSKCRVSRLNDGTPCAHAPTPHLRKITENQYTNNALA